MISWWLLFINNDRDRPPAPLLFLHKASGSVKNLTEPCGRLCGMWYQVSVSYVVLRMLVEAMFLLAGRSEIARMADSVQSRECRALYRLERVFRILYTTSLLGRRSELNHLPRYVL